MDTVPPDSYIPSVERPQRSLYTHLLVWRTAGEEKTSSPRYLGRCVSPGMCCSEKVKDFPGCFSMHTAVGVRKLARIKLGCQFEPLLLKFVAFLCFKQKKWASLSLSSVVLSLLVLSICFNCASFCHCFGRILL